METQVHYLTEKQVSKITSKALATLRNDRHHKRGIRYLKDGRSVRYDYRDVISYMESKKIEVMND